MDTRQDTITITIDGREVACRPGELLIEVARRAGVHIPYFCWHPRMDPVGACRMCLVHISPGPPKPQTSCTTRVTDGMAVQTQFSNADVRAAQSGVLEFLLINHPLDCPICDRAGECPLQDQTQDYGPAESRFIEAKRRFTKPVPISALITLDRERCILCYRCTRFCEEISGDTLIAAMDRGPKTYIYPFEGEDFDSYFGGNTVQICPVGALTSTPYRFRARPWDLQATPTTCTLCASGCSLVANVRTQDGNVVRFSAATNEDTNEEWVCDKGRYGHAYVSSPSRLRTPMVRRDGELVEVSWDDAFAALAARLGPLIGSDGATADLGVLTGASLCDEDAYTAQKFARLVCGTNAVIYRLAGGMSADALVAPELTYDDLLASDHVILVSLDAREELPLVFLRLRVAVTKRGLRLTSIHPRRVASGVLGTHLAPFPATEAQLGAALAASLGQPVAAGVEVLAAAAGVPAAQVRTLGDELRADRDPVILLGPSVAADPQAVRAWRAVGRAAGARVGWAPRRAGEYGALAAGAHPDLLPGWRRVSDPGDRAEVAGIWGSAVPEAPGLDAAQILGRARDGSLELLWLVGADVVADVPDARLGADAVRGARYTVVQDVQHTDVTALADLILPAAAFVERAGTLTDWEGRRQPVVQAVDPPGAARADYAILAEAARRLDRPIGCRTLAEVGAEIDRLARTAPRAGDGDAGTVRAQPPVVDPAFPLRLCTYRLLYDEGSRVSHTAEIGELTPKVFVELHPTDAAAAGVDDGASVRVTSSAGSLVAPARVSADVRPGVVFVPYRQPGGSARALMTVGDPAPGVRVERI